MKGWERKTCGPVDQDNCFDQVHKDEVSRAPDFQSREFCTEITGSQRHNKKIIGLSEERDSDSSQKDIIGIWHH
jgi:hypothetical protein